MKYTTLTLFLGSAAARRQLPAIEGYSVGEGSYCRREADDKVGRVTEFCRDCTASKCADECNNDSTCGGFDFHERGAKICWLHYDYPQKLMTEGCPECDCYLKSGFEGKGTPPSYPKRPDHVEGFRFEQGKCMSKKGGKPYMSGRWEVPGNFENDGLSYNECAQKCAERTQCTGFDIWEGNHDCQLFFDEDFEGDGTKEEECFIKENFTGKKIDFSREYMKQAFNHFGSDGHLTLEQFATGFRTIDPEVEDKQVKGGFNHADLNKDGLLNFYEFTTLVRDLYQPPQGEFEGYERQEGYCMKPGDQHPIEKDWKEPASEIFGFETFDCAMGCDADPTCSAFTVYHEDKKCYFFKPTDIVAGFAKKEGVCYTKKGLRRGPAPIFANLRNVVSSEKQIASDKSGDENVEMAGSGASKIIMSTLMSVASLIALAQ